MVSIETESQPEIAAREATELVRHDSFNFGVHLWPRNVLDREAGMRGARGRDWPLWLGVQPQRNLFCGPGKSPSSPGIPGTGVVHGCATS